MNVIRGIQGRTHDIAMLVGGAVGTESHPDQEAWWQAKWNLYRFQVLTFFYTFRGITPKWGVIDHVHLEKAGLLEAEERVIIEKAVFPRKICLKWIAAWVGAHVQDLETRQLIMDKVCGLRGATATLHDTLEMRAPYSFEALLYSTIWVWMLLLPFTEIRSTDDRRAVLEAGVLFATIRCMIVCAMYLTLIDLLEAFKRPFASDSDSLNIEAILLESEATVLEYYSAPVSEKLEQFVSDDLYYKDKIKDGPPKLAVFDIE